MAQDEKEPITFKPQWVDLQERSFAAGLSPDGRILATSDSNEVSIWATDDLHRVTRFPCMINEPYQIVFSPCGRFMASGGYKPPLRVWLTSTWEHVASVPFSGYVSVSAFNADGSLLALGGYAGVHIVETKTWSVVCLLEDLTSITSVKFFPCSRHKGASPSEHLLVTSECAVAQPVALYDIRPGGFASRLAVEFEITAPVFQTATDAAGEHLILTPDRERPYLPVLYYRRVRDPDSCKYERVASRDLNCTGAAAVMPFGLCAVVAEHNRLVLLRLPSMETIGTVSLSKLGVDPEVVEFVFISPDLRTLFATVAVGFCKIDVSALGLSVRARLLSP
jgi:hypothetical protein